MDLSADQANSSVMWTRRRPAAGEPLAAWSDTPVDAASEMIATCFRPSMKALRSATLRLWSPESPPRASYLNLPEGPRTTRPDRPVYAGLSLTVNPGETVAFVGESGAGKSTAVQLLLRYYDCDGGRVLVDGLDVRSVGVKSLRASIGLVSQEPCLFTGTIADNIRYGKPAATDDEVERAAKLANAFDFVGTFPDGFGTAVGARGVQLSGGQKQRVAIARALVRDPRCLVLDEATSALDAKSERVVQDALDALLATTKCTTIVIAHRLSTIKHASKICVFGDGVLKEEGPHEALMDARGPYFGLVSHQLGGDAN